MAREFTYRATLVAGDNLFTPSGVSRSAQIAVQNMDTTSSFYVKINDDPNGWQMDPGDKLGVRKTAMITKVILTPVSGTPAYQLMFL